MGDTTKSILIWLLIIASLFGMVFLFAQLLKGYQSSDTSSKPVYTPAYTLPTSPMPNEAGYRRGFYSTDSNGEAVYNSPRDFGKEAADMERQEWQREQEQWRREYNSRE